MLNNKELKRRIVEISYKLGLSHIGSNITAVDIIKEIYDIKKPYEKFILSAGHAHLAHLVVREFEGMIDFPTGENAETLIEKYGIHCDRKAGCDVSTGSLGHGIGISCGLAIADRSKSVYCLLSDGELAEGSVYEAINVIKAYDIKNLKLYINFNGWGAYRKVGEQSHMGAISGVMKTVKSTNMDDYPKYLQGQLAHYKVLNKKEYKEVMEILK